MMYCSIRILILLREAFLGNRSSRLSLIDLASWAFSRIFTSINNELVFPFSMLFCLRAKSITSFFAGVAIMDPSLSPVEPKFLVVEMDETRLMRAYCWFRLFITYLEMVRHFGSSLFIIFTESL